MIEVAVPGQSWEIEFLEDGNIEIEKLTSDKKMYDKVELEVLFRDYSD